MKKLTIGDVTITSIIERDGPWRKPEDMFIGYDPALGKRLLAEMDKEVAEMIRQVAGIVDGSNRFGNGG